jgi:hypothetical protein
MNKNKNLHWHAGFFMVVYSEFKLYLNLPLNLGMKLGKENRI